MAQPGSSAVVTAVARFIAEAPSLADVISRVAATVGQRVPFAQMHVLRLERANAVTLYVARASGELDVIGHRIPDEQLGSSIAAGDASAAALPLVESGARSIILCTLRQSSRVVGALWLTSNVPEAFDDEHRALADCVADLLALAVYHDVVRSTEAVRRERLQSLDRLLQTMAESLDIRQVFDEVSEVVRGALPHDILALTAWGQQGRSFRVYAMAGATVDDPSFWESTALNETDRTLLHREPYIVADAAAGNDPSVRGRIFRRLGVRAALRVAMPLGSDVFGSLFFLAREPDRFSEEDFDFARQVAQHLALALSHQRLAEAARRNAEARETAARLEEQVAKLTRELESRAGHGRLIGHSQRWKEVLAQAARVAQTETTVLLTGESGTGKEVVARFIHEASPRNRGPFIAINCAALPDQLLESELFGHERGAFTGAVASKPGRIEQANGGVLFLDEVGEMSTAVQAKLLRVLEQREFLRLGGTRLLRADIRVIAATNRNLMTAIQRGAFREDLYYRLGVFEIPLPPLRDRPEDILELAGGFLEEIGSAVGRPAVGITRDAKDQLLAYSWPGNVRELRNAIERAVILADGGYIRSEHLPGTAPRLTAPSTDVSPTAPLPAGGVNLEAIERSLVLKALTQARHNKTRAAKLLGLTRAQLYSRIEKYGLAESES
jgi:transcriptional regulator with GAF, ATPase, and Fis domain